MSRGRSPRHVGTVTAASLVVGSMVGVGVYTSLGFQLDDMESGGSILVLWGVGAVLALAGALCYAELAGRFPRSGGEYHLLSRAVNRPLGFLIGWVSALAGFALPSAAGALTLGVYVNEMLPHIDAQWVALRVLLIVGAVHLLHLRIGSAFLNVFTGLKVLFMLGIIGAAFLWFDAPQAVDWAPRPAEMARGSYAKALVYVSYAYVGWNGAVYVIDEMRSPQRTVPRGLLLGTALVALLYLGLNAAFLVSAPAEALRGKVEVGLIVGEHLFGPAGGRVVAVFVCLGLVSLVSAMTWAGPRVLQRMGQDYRRLGWLARTNVDGVPWTAVVTQTAVAAVAVMAADVRVLVEFTGYTLGLGAVLVVLATVWLRLRKPSGLGRFRMPLWPLWPTLFVLGTGWMLVWLVVKEPAQSATSVALMLAALPVWVWAEGGERRR